ncbi:MAG: CRISPR-associated protein Cas4 [Candidatus Acetothermia bacterium]|jgi:CRISPR-associated exonuclease Cas4|nr:CRISPR-associated protein Cas4 [Candidatus Acetothermia bacterium]MDH7506084.1 CRISPR-associated protein Cas4 [Candidatus Acetothermia bacterium]
MDDLPLHTGTEVNYYVVCRRKLWLYSHHLELERSSDRVALGALLHETSYERLPKREVLIDSLIKVDILEGSGKVLEVKYSQKMAEAARLQVLYYLYYLKRKGLTGLVGEVRFPRQRRIEQVYLTEEAERQVEAALEEIARLNELEAPPQAEWTPICRPCAYAEFCWG